MSQCAHIESSLGSSLRRLQVRKWRALSSALHAHQYGCFVPDLTRFPGRACEGTRQAQEYMGWLQELQNFASCAACTHSAFARAVLVFAPDFTKAVCWALASICLCAWRIRASAMPLPPNRREPVRAQPFHSSQTQPCESGAEPPFGHSFAAPAADRFLCVAPKRF